MNEKTLIIVGASARAAAHSALRAGRRPWCADLFADADLAACCPARRIERYPAELLEIIAAAPDAPWMYTGALENHPALVDRLAARRRLWGNSGEALRRVRDPFLLAHTLRAHDLPMPDCRHIDALPEDGERRDWLLKPRHSAGGRRIGFLTTQSLEQHLGGCAWYVQRFVPGTPLAAVLIAAAGRATLLGITRQCLAANGQGEPFVYTGSIGPWPLGGEQLQALHRLGDLLATQFGLAGVMGVDMVLDDNGRPWTIEVNPRYTASMEVLDRALGISCIAAHAAAFEGQPSECHGSVSRAMNPSASYCGKRFLIAPHDLHISEKRSRRWLEQSSEAVDRPPLADIPAAGTTLRRGQPVLTMLADGGSLEEVESKLESQHRELLAILTRGG